MALIYPKSTISPTKLQLLAAWVPTQPWGATGAALTVLGAYRFDDPEGEVGIETHLVQAGERLLHVPTTYRPSPLRDAEAALITTMEHTQLGRRWVYDGCLDPVYVRTLVATMTGGGSGAEYQFHGDDGELVTRPTAVRVSGTGGAAASVAEIGTVTARSDVSRTVVDAGGVEVAVLRDLAVALATPGPALTATWPDSDTPRVVAALTR